jgi:hypothetical protein
MYYKTVMLQGIKEIYVYIFYLFAFLQINLTITYLIAKKIIINLASSILTSHIHSITWA